MLATIKTEKDVRLAEIVVKRLFSSQVILKTSKK